MAGQTSTHDLMLEHWKRYQCPAGRNGDCSKCTATKELLKKNAKAFRIEPDRKVHYYCFVGCLMLDLSEDERKRFSEFQFNLEGHYEKSGDS